MLLNSTIFS